MGFVCGDSRVLVILVLFGRFVDRSGANKLSVPNYWHRSIASSQLPVTTKLTDISMLVSRADRADGSLSVTLRAKRSRNTIAMGSSVFEHLLGATFTTTTCC
eukprot:60470-Amphidinium_carterae.3